MKQFYTEKDKKIQDLIIDTMHRVKELRTEN